MSIRGSDRRERLGSRVAGQLFALLLGLLMLTPVSPGLSCARYSSGHYHKVAAGENLYRIGLRYGVPAEDLARINRIGDVTEISVGQRIWIPTRPGARPLALSSRQVSSKGPRSGANSAAASRARQSARREVQRQSNLDFVWPVRGGKLTSRFGRRNGRPHEGIDLAAGRGTRILAAEAGKVIHSGRLGDYGKVVILKHAGRYRTVYAHANKLFVRKGQFVEKGDRIAAVGSSGRSSGPHLHFEIRQRESPRDPMLYLP